MSKQDRQAVRTAAELEQKHKFGKQFAEVMGIATDARDAAYFLDDELHGKDGLIAKHSELSRDLDLYKVTVGATYAKTGDLEGLQETIEANFGVEATKIFGEISKDLATSESVEAIKENLQNQLDTIGKYFSFTIDGMKIGATTTEIDEETGETIRKESPYHIVIDNDDISIWANGTVVQQFDAQGNALVPHLKAQKSADILGLLVTKSDTHINVSYEGGV